MKLYLSSYGLGNNPEKLQELVGANKLAAVILNAQDLATPDERVERWARGRAEMERVGFKSEELDLRDYFGKPDELRAALKKFGLLWIRGGNTFVLRRAMRMSGFDVHIREVLEQDDLVYAGFSAASCVAAPTLRGTDLVDDPITVPDGYDAETLWDGLGLISYAIAPHYRSDHFESPLVEETVKYFEIHNIPYKALRDGQAIVINGAHEEITG